MRQNIIFNKYPQGSRLLEVELSQEYGVSRGTIRSTLQELAAEGLVEYLDTVGCISVGLDEKIIRDTYDFRCSLEIQAANIFLSGGQFSYVGMLKILDEYLQKEQDPLFQTDPASYYVNMDIRFHQAMMYAAQNRPIYRAWCSMAPVIRTLLLLNMTDSYRASFNDRFYPNHKALVDYAILRDPALLDEIRSQILSGVDRAIKHLHLRQTSTPH